MFCKKIDRGKGRSLFLYSLKKKTYEEVLGLESIKMSGQHLRWHAFREEWVCYSPVRQSRTFLPKKDECPLCPSINNKSITDIPVTDYEIAVFNNRFSAFNFNQNTNDRDPNKQPSYGSCEVISYSKVHNTSLPYLDIKNIELLIKVWGDRITQLMKDPKIKYVIPFENRGEEVGVTLHHPHGQIYALPMIPDIILKQANNHSPKKKMNSIINSLDKDLILKHDNISIVFVPPFARYPYEIWIAPLVMVDNPSQLKNLQIKSLAKSLKYAIQKLDKLFNAPMPYTMAVNTAPKGFEGKFHHYISIQLMKRDKDKLKFLAGIEQITGLMLADINPEEAAIRLKRVKIE